jgi:ribonuclease P/MRP protein subunit RPP1
MERVLIQETNFDKARKLIKENSGKKIIFTSDDDELNRKILEKENINVLLLNMEKRKDFQKQRNSGLNHIFAKLAKKKDVRIGINLDEIIKTSEKEKARILARIKQNIEICNKEKVNMEFLYKNNKRNIYDIKSLGLILGMPTWMLKGL